MTNKELRELVANSDNYEQFKNLLRLYQIRLPNRSIAHTAFSR